MAVRHFKLPDPGEGLVEAEIVTWKVKVGDVVKVNDIILEIETAKSLVELPVPFAGTVVALLAAEGETVAVGSPVISVDDNSSAEVAAVAQVASTTSAGQGQIESATVDSAAPDGRVAVLVGYGPRMTEAKRRPRSRVGAPAAAPASVVPARQVEPVAARPVPTSSSGSGKALAKPPVRKLAKDLGVDLSQVTGSGAGGIVTRADVETQAAGGHGLAGGAPAASYTAHKFPVTAEREMRIPIKGVRKLTAQAMVGSAFTAPHVTEFITRDVTAMMRLVDRLRLDPEFRDVKVGPLLVVAKALIVASARNPGVNASWDEAAGEIVVKNYVNLGIAAATPRGLMVPNIKNADQMSLGQLAHEMATLVSTARAGKTQPAAMTGGSITVTNVGVFGVDAGTPILNPGEAAILCFGAVRKMPWVVKGKIKPRWVTQLSLSFDHRLIDGEQGSRFLADIAAILHDPSLALVWG